MSRLDPARDPPFRAQTFRRRTVGLRPAVTEGRDPHGGASAWLHHIRNTPNRVSATGAFSAADSDSASTRRVSAGSMIPSSHSRAVA